MMKRLAGIAIIVLVAAMIILVVAMIGARRDMGIGSAPPAAGCAVDLAL